mmetsp:Transcript_19320/g.23867  ORF Transcript_19320/g.23867 Transcript_19320/m.23867 type:complete len:110 (+) Transcript_19320:336-665(+)
MKISKDRHTRHLKRDEVSAYTASVRDNLEAKRKAFQSTGRQSGSVVDSLTGDPFKKVFEQRSKLQAQELAYEKLARTQTLNTERLAREQRALDATNETRSPVRLPKTHI